jgi:hypothetical protein
MGRRNSRIHLNGIRLNSRQIESRERRLSRAIAMTSSRREAVVMTGNTWLEPISLVADKARFACVLVGGWTD